MDWSAPALSESDLHEPGSQVFEALKALTALRRRHDAFDQGPITILPLDNKHLFGALKSGSEGPVVVIANFSEHPQPLNDWGVPGVLGTDTLDDLWTGRSRHFAPGLMLDAYAFHCFAPGSQP
jgi:glycosidase